MPFMRATLLAGDPASLTAPAHPWVSRSLFARLVVSHSWSTRVGAGSMSLTPGWTDDEVREFVYEYARQPWGTRRSWLVEQGVSWNRFRRWRSAVEDGDLDRGLVPREGSAMTTENERRQFVNERQRHAAETERLRERVRELEATNEALGKAIGLLHQLNAQEPDTVETNEPRDSFGPRTSS